MLQHQTARLHLHAAEDPFVGSQYAVLLDEEICQPWPAGNEPPRTQVRTPVLASLHGNLKWCSLHRNVMKTRSAIVGRCGLILKN